LSYEDTFDLLRKLNEESRAREAEVAVVMHKCEDRRLKELEANPPHSIS
jgi:hypothetical protein